MGFFKSGFVYIRCLVGMLDSLKWLTIIKELIKIDKTILITSHHTTDIGRTVYIQVYTVEEFSNPKNLLKAASVYYL